MINLHVNYHQIYFEINYYFNFMSEGKDGHENNINRDNQCNHLEIDQDFLSRLTYHISIFIKNKLIVLCIVIYLDKNWRITNKVFQL